MRFMKLNYGLLEITVDLKAVVALIREPEGKCRVVFGSNLFQTVDQTHDEVRTAWIAYNESKVTFGKVMA